MSASTKDRQISANQHVQIFKCPHDSSLVVNLHHTVFILHTVKLRTSVVLKNKYVICKVGYMQSAYKTWAD